MTKKPFVIPPPSEEEKATLAELAEKWRLAQISMGGSITIYHGPRHTSRMQGKVAGFGSSNAKAIQKAGRAPEIV